MYGIAMLLLIFHHHKEHVKEKIMDMEEIWQFPCCWAAVDGCHISIKCPDGGAEAAKEYHNFKNFYSIVLMGLVDAKYRFVWASVGFPGNTHDAMILQATQRPSFGKTFMKITLFL
jgi:hypothetical protein